MKNLLKMSDLSPAELTHILDVADQLKADCKAGRTEPLLAGKSVALLFSKASTRTRTSFEVGVYQMGGLGNYMNTAELQAGRGEPLRDTARVLGRYYDCAVWRTYRQRDLEELAELSGIPVINGLTDYAHPCQVLADLMTIRERRGTLAGLKLCFVGDGSNMANSLIVGGLLAGMQVSCVCPPGYRPAADVLMFAHKYGNAFHLTTDPAEGLRDADIVATAAWNTTAPGTAESEQRLRDFVGFQLTGRLLENAKPNALVLHCLPAHRGEEISTALFEQHADEIFDEAENRLHVQKAVLAVLLAGKSNDLECPPLSGCGTQHPLRALGGTRVLLAAAPTTPPCFRRWRRSSSLHFGHQERKEYFVLQFRNACGRFGTAFLRERLRWKASQAHIRLQPFFCVPKGCARAFLGLFRAIRCISGAIHAELLYFCRRSWYTTDTEQCSVQYAIPVIPIEQKTVR